MFKRRSRFSSRRGGAIDPRLRMGLAALAGIGLLAAFIVLIRAGDAAAPPRQETRIELPDVFKAQ